MDDSKFSSRFSPGARLPAATVSRQRTILQVGYLTSFAHSASNSVLHVFQCAEPHRVAIGVPARRVLMLCDETAFDLPFEGLLKRCAVINQIVEMALFPNEVE